MKYIFDFDDTLFITDNLREQMFSVLEKKGISREATKEYYEKERLSNFSLKKLLKDFSLDQNLYEEIMNRSADFMNTELIEVVKKAGKKNCYIVTCGDKEFQKDKIERSGVAPLFSEIIIVPGTKKEAVENLCARHKDETIIFIDDKLQYFEDLDLKKYPNLKTVLYAGQDLHNLVA